MINFPDEPNELKDIVDKMSERFVKAYKEGRGMRLTPEEVIVLTCVNWNTVENPKFDE